MPVTDQQTSRAMAQLKSGLSRALLLCFVAMLVVGMSFAGTAGAQTTEDYLESNDDLDSATDVGSGDSYDDLSIHDSTDEDYFAVDVEEGETISASIDFDHTDGDLDLEIQDENGYYLDGSYSVTDDESASYTVDESGTYYVQVYGYSGETGSYDLDISTEEAVGSTPDSLEPNDDRTSATVLSDTSSYDDLTLDSSDDEDYFEVYAEAGETINADIFFDDDNGDIDLEIEDENGYYVDGSYSVSDDESVSYDVEESGTYYIRVHPWSGAPNSYDLDVNVTDTATTGDSLEPNDDLDSATELGSGGSYDNLEVSDFDDSDYFRVYADSGDTINADIFFSDAEGDVDLELQDENGYYLDGSYSTTDDESVSYTVDESGYYYVEVYPFSGSPTSYDIDVSTDDTGSSTGDSLEPNDDLDSATDLGTGGSYDDLEVSDFDDSDYFAVEADAGDTITAEIFFDDDDGDIDLELQDENGYYLEGSYSVTDDESITYTVDESGTYYVEVYPWSGSPTSYDIDVSTDDTGSSTGDSLEPNDDLDSATELGSGGSYDDLEVSDFDDSDYFRVYADSGDTINADIFFDDDEGDVDLEIQDENGYYLDGSYSVTDDESVSYTVDESGYYYVEVYPFSGSPTSYDIDVSVDSGDDQIDTGTDLRSISIGETAEGTIDTSDPTLEGYYHEPVSFYGQAGTTVDIGMTSETGDTYLVLQAPNGTYLTYDDDGGDDLNSEISDYELPETGSYTIIATSYSGSSTFDYELSVTSDGSTDSGTQTNEDLSLSANSSATAGGDMLVEFTLENTGSSDQAVILQAGDGVDQLGDGYSVSAHSDDGGNWRSSENSWLFDSLSGEVNPSITIDVPEDAEGTQYMTVVAESDEGNVSTTVVLDLDDIGIVQEADTNDNGELSDSEILAAIEAWRTDSTIEGTDVTVSDEDIITLISTWRSEGS